MRGRFFERFQNQLWSVAHQWFSDRKPDYCLQACVHQDTHKNKQTVHLSSVRLLIDCLLVINWSALIINSTAMAGRKTRERVRKCLQIFLAQLFSQVGLCAIVVGYSVGGAVVFQHLERDSRPCHGVEREHGTIRDKFLSDIWNLTAQHDEWSNWTMTAVRFLKGFSVPPNPSLSAFLFPRRTPSRS